MDTLAREAVQLLFKEGGLGWIVAFLLTVGIIWQFLHFERRMDQKDEKYEALQEKHLALALELKDLVESTNSKDEALIAALSVKGRRS